MNLKQRRKATERASKMTNNVFKDDPSLYNSYYLFFTVITSLWNEMKWSWTILVVRTSSKRFCVSPRHHQISILKVELPQFPWLKNMIKRAPADQSSYKFFASEQAKPARRIFFLSFLWWVHAYLCWENCQFDIRKNKLWLFDIQSSFPTYMSPDPFSFANLTPGWPSVSYCR